MQMIKKIIRQVQFTIRDVLINRKRKKRIQNKSMTIISNDCLGGVLYHDLRLQFLSPTINMFFPASDFIKFISDINYYLSADAIETVDPDYKYPLCFLGVGEKRILIHLMHFKTFSEFKRKWDERVERINFENIFYIMNDRNWCSYEDIKAFDELPLKNKICFTHKPYTEFKSTYYITGSEKEKEVKPLMDFVHPLGIARYYDQFDFVGWFNQN